MCSKHEEAWNKLIIKFSATSWLILRNKNQSLVFSKYPEFSSTPGDLKSKIFMSSSAATSLVKTARSHIFIVWSLKENLQEHFYWTTKYCRMPCLCDCTGSYRFTGRNYVEFFKSVRRQLESVLTTLKNNYAVIDFTPQVWEIVACISSK